MALPIPTSQETQPDGILESDREHPEAARGISHVAVARSIYGLLLVMTVLEAMEIHPPHAGWAGPELLVGTLLAVALAEVYSDVFAGLFAHKKRLCRDALGHLGRETAPLLIGLPLPVAVLVISALGLVGIHHAIDAAQIIAYTSLLICGWWMARNLGARQAARVLDGPFGQRLADDMAARTKLHLLGFVSPPGLHILTNSDRPVASPEEMWGLRLRAIPGSKPLEAMIRAVGASPMRVSSREELAALASGSVDGQMSPPAVVLARGFDRVQRYATLTDHLYVPYVWLFNKAALAALSDDDRRVVEQAAGLARARAQKLALTLRQSDQGTGGLGKRMSVTPLNAARRAAFKAALRPPVEDAVLTEIGADGPRWLAELSAATAAAR